jgi:peptide/nickel transport system substrate-binding protein
MNRARKMFWLLAVMLPALLLAPTAGRAKDRLTVAVEANFDTLDVYATVHVQLINLYFHLNDPLLGRDPVDLSLKPHLVTEWARLDPTTWRFRLRPGVKFHTGRELTAAAVKFTFEEIILAPERRSPLAEGFRWVKEVRVLGDHDFLIITARPYPLVLDRLTYLFPYDPAYVREVGPTKLAERPVGVGPYRLARYERGSRLELSLNPDYWRPLQPTFRNIVFRIIPEASTRLAELISGGVDLAANLEPDQLPVVERQPDLKVIGGPTFRLNFWQFDGGGKAAATPLTDVRVRRAIGHAVDRRTIAAQVLNGRATVVDAPTIPGHFGHDPGLQAPAYDPARARALLKEAGQETGLSVDLWNADNQQSLFNKAAADYLAQVGVQAKLRDYQGYGGQLIKLRESGKVTGIGTYSWGSLFVLDADAVLPSWFLTQENRNYNPDPDLDKWLTEARYSLDPERRRALYVQAQRRIIDQAYWLPLYLKHALHGARRELKLDFRPDDTLRLHEADWIE